MTNVLVTDYAWPTLDIERRIVAEAGGELIVACTGDEAELIELAPRADAILTCWKPVTPAVLEAAPRCLLVSRYGIGLDNIAVDAATRLGMLVTNVPDFCLDEVADHALALMLALNRRIVQLARETRAGVWNPTSGRPMYRLRGQTLGLVGYGNIARNLAPKAVGLGLKVLTYDPMLKPGPVAASIEAAPDLDTLLGAADFVSVHVPLTPATRGLINERNLRLMKPTACLINTARGPIVDEAALGQALAEGWIAGAGLDVTSPEPPAPDNPLLSLPNVIVTPHASFYSEQSLVDLAERAAGHVAQVLRGEAPTNIVNPAVMQQANYRFTDARRAELAGKS